MRSEHPGVTRAAFIEPGRSTSRRAGDKHSAAARDRPFAHALESPACVPSFEGFVVRRRGTAAPRRAARARKGTVAQRLVKSRRPSKCRFVDAVVQSTISRAAIFALGEGYVEGRMRAGLEPRGSVRPPAADEAREHGPRSLVPEPEKEAR